MPRNSNIMIIAGGGMLCAATAASLTAATWPAASPSVITHQVQTADPVDAARTTSAILPAWPGAISLASEALAIAGAKGVHAQADGKPTLPRFNAGHKAHMAHIAHEAHLAHQAHMAHKAYVPDETNIAYAAHMAHEAHVLHELHLGLLAGGQQQSSFSSSDSSASQVASASSGSPQKIAQQMLDAVGRGGQFSCLDALWNRESGWNVYATNPGSGAYGIPQSLPANKMASAGSDWRTNAATQIRWGLSYINSTYGSPCAAWSHEKADGWY
jgi:hypothetical protein